MRVLSFDPGEETGWAYQDERDDYPGGILDFGQIIGIKALVEFLEKWERTVDQVVIEDYITWGGAKGAKANAGSRMETVRVIGVLESWCYRHEYPFYKSNPQDNALYAKQCGFDPKANGAHSKTHWIYAANHGRKWLQSKGYAKTALQRAIQNGKET